MTLKFGDVGDFNELVLTKVSAIIGRARVGTARSTRVVRLPGTLRSLSLRAAEQGGWISLRTSAKAQDSNVFADR